MFTRLSSATHDAPYGVEDRDSSLRGFIAVHSTHLGPAAGGLRMRPYADEAAAITQVLDLSRGMSYANVAVGLPQGGDIAEIKRETRHIARRDQGEHASGDPSPVTARGVYAATQANMARILALARAEDASPAVIVDRLVGEKLSPRAW
jgi:leucine dehydrogenase